MESGKKGSKTMVMAGLFFNREYVFWFCYKAFSSDETINLVKGYDGWMIGEI